MRTKEEILKWVKNSNATSDERLAIIELLADIRDLLIDNKKNQNMDKLNIKEFEALEIPQNGATIFRTYNSKELQIQHLAEKVNEIVDFINVVTKNKKNKTCTCKMDEQWNPKIDKACYWHGK